jgi:anti-sigma regulatory factor (Ser/Thr protein kinase)
VPTEIAQQLPAGPDAAAEARRLVGRLPGWVGEAALRDLRLLVSELVTNSVRHGRQPSGTPVSVQVEVTGDVARGEVVDLGPGFEPPAGGPRSQAGSGWGLVLVDALSERWGVELNDRTRVWFELALGSGGGPSPPVGGGAQTRRHAGESGLFAPATTG